MNTLTSNELLFRVWLEQRAFRRAKPRNKWTQTDRDFMNLSFSEFKEKTKP